MLFMEFRLKTASKSFIHSQNLINEWHPFKLHAQAFIYPHSFHTLFSAPVILLHTQLIQSQRTKLFSVKGRAFFSYPGKDETNLNEARRSLQKSQPVTNTKWESKSRFRGR